MSDDSRGGNEGRGGMQANGSNYSSSSPRSAMSAESMGGGGGNYGRQHATGILKKESILKNSYNGSVDAERRPSGIVYKKITSCYVNNLC